MHDECCQLCTAWLSRVDKVCNQPVVQGKTKCRGHGGLSTGPRTKEGLKRLAAAQTVHGRETRALRALRSKIGHDLRELVDRMIQDGTIQGPRIKGRKPSLWRQAGG
jgi:hypothetical protein